MLAAGEKITLDLDPAGLISVAVDVVQGTDRNDNTEYAAVNNRGEIVADGSKVILSADILNSAFTSAVNNDGIIEANEFQSTDGLVLLKSNQNIELNGEIYASGAIDAYADENIILGLPIEDLILSTYEWEYISKESRAYKFKEFGYYYNGGDPKVILSQGYDIGKDSGSPMSGFGLTELPGMPLGLYIVMDPLTGAWHTLYEDPSLNPDGLDHINLVGTEYWWEDIIGLGDKDFNDVIIDFIEDITTIGAPDAILNAPDIFLTANNGYIKQFSGDIYAENLMLSANTGMSGTGSNGGIETMVENVSAFNKTSGDIRISNVGQDLTIADLSGVKGLNTDEGVCGYNGVTNCAIDGEVNIEAIEGEGADLLVEAPVHSYGPVTFLAQDHIRHTDLGDVTVHNPYTAPGAPTNLSSPSHIIGFEYVNFPDHTVDVTWQLPEGVPAYGFQATAEGGEYEMAVGTEIKTQGGNVDINAVDDITLSLIDARNGNVEVTSSQGSIEDGDGGSTPLDYDVIARNIKLSAPNGTVGAGDAIDLGFPYDFSYIWDNTSNTEPDSLADPYTNSFDSVTGDWTFATTSEDLADGSWWFHVNTLDYPEVDYSPCRDGSCPEGELELESTFTQLRREVCNTVASPAVHANFIFDSDIPPPPDDEPVFFQALQELRIYYEILDPSQFLVYEPAQQLGLYAYHPLTSADLTAFDDIKLDAGAYDFISENIEMKKKKANPYFGL